MQKDLCYNYVYKFIYIKYQNKRKIIKVIYTNVLKSKKITKKSQLKIKHFILK